MEWINAKEEIDRRMHKIARNRANAIYKRKNNEWINKELEDIEKDRKNNKLKQFYKKMKIKNFKPRTKIRGIKNINGNTEHELQEIGRIWENHYAKALNSVGEEEREGPNEENIMFLQEEEEEELKCPTKAEVQEEIKRVSNGKAPGGDGIEFELLKYEGQELHRQIYLLLKQICTQNKMQEEWNTGIIIPIYKRGELGNNPTE